MQCPRQVFSNAGLRTLRAALPIFVGSALLLGASAAADSSAELNSAAERDVLVSNVVGEHGGRLVVALRAEPTTFNPVTALDNPSLTILRRITADLVHVDRATQLPAAALAKSWQRSADGLQYILNLRRGIRFSDGHAFDAEDVMFTFEVLLDSQVGSPHRDFLMPGGQAIVAEKVDAHTLRFQLHRPNAAGLRLFDNLPILPKHRLEEPYRQGRLGEMWGTGSDPKEIVGLGPFQIESYVPGEQVVLSRNPHYWKVDSKGRSLPFLDQLVFVFVADQTAQTLRFQAGEVHVVDRLKAESFAYLQTRPGKTMWDLGPGLEYSFLFFNLNHLEDRPDLERKQKWFKEDRFRRAISTAIDRQGIAGLIYAGQARPLATHVTPGIQQWAQTDLEPTPQSLTESRRILEEMGFRLRGKRLHDAGGLPVELTIISTSSNQERLGMATIVQEDLRQLGIGATVVGLEFRALLDRVFNSFDYEAVVLSMNSGDTDPNALIPVLTSGGGNHLWQLKAGTELPRWQQEIDALMSRQAVTLDDTERKRMYGRVQQLVAEHLPMIFLVSPHVLAGSASALGNFRPTVLGHSTLWNAEELYWKSSAGN